MRRLAYAFLALGLSSAAAAAAAAPAPDDVRASLRTASAITRLSVKRPLAVSRPAPAEVRRRRALLEARAYPAASRAHDAEVYHALGLAASASVARRALEPVRSAAVLWDVERRRLLAARGTRPSRHAWLRTVATGLLDQHFDLRRLELARDDRDALAAAGAASEGYATLVADLVADRPRARPPRPDRLSRFLALQRAFPSTRGAAFAAELRNLGFNRAVWTSIRRFPHSTEQVFHLDKFLQRERPLRVALPLGAAGMTLAGSGAFGELDVRSLLAVFRVPGLDRAATGWGGGRTARYRGAAGTSIVVALDWDAPRDAEEWSAAFDRFAGPALGDRPFAFVRDGVRTRLVIGPTGDAANALAAALLAISTSS